MRSSPVSMAKLGDRRAAHLADHSALIALAAQLDLDGDVVDLEREHPQSAAADTDQIVVDDGVVGQLGEAVNSSSIVRREEPFGLLDEARRNRIVIP